MISFFVIGYNQCAKIRCSCFYRRMQWIEQWVFKKHLPVPLPHDFIVWASTLLSHHCFQPSKRTQAVVSERKFIECNAFKFASKQNDYQTNTIYNYLRKDYRRMRNNIVHPGADELKYEIRKIVEVGENIEKTGIKIIWDNIGDPVAKGEKVPIWIKEIVADTVINDNSSYG